MKNQTKQSGITLISLIITIIIMLILVGVTVSISINGGLFSISKDATSRTQIAKEKEQIMAGYSAYQMASVQGEEANLEVAGATVAGNEDSGWIITFNETGNKYNLYADGKIEKIEDEVIEDEANYILKWNCGYNENASGSSTSSVVGFLVKNDDNDEYTLIFKGKGKMDSAVRWNINNISCAWTRGDSESAEIENYKSKITKVIISEGITELSDDDLIFYHCDNISEIEFAKSVIIKRRRSVSFAQKWLESQRKINPLVIVNNSLVDGYNCSNTVTIPNNINIICDEAFSYNKKITNIETEDNVEIIGDSAFEQCTALKTFYYSKNLKHIGKRAFNMCTSLENIDLPEGLETIGQLRI